MSNPIDAQKFITEYETERESWSDIPVPKTLPLSEIISLPNVFQFRLDGLTRYHIEDLIRAIRKTGVLEPIKVCRYNGKYAVVDGHHRFEAYQEAQYSKEIPVQILLPNSGLELIEQALDSNRKHKLNMQTAERTEGAWTIARLMKRSTGALGAKRLAEATGISKGTCQNFRKAFDALENDDLDPFDFTWMETKSFLNGRGSPECQDWGDSAARDFAETVLYREWRITPKKLEHVRRYPEGMAELLSLITGSQMETVVKLLQQRLPEQDLYTHDF